MSSTEPAAVANLNAVGLSLSLTVNDLSKSLQFYTEGLGFEVEEEHEFEGEVRFVQLKAGAAQIGLGQDDFALGRDRVKGVVFNYLTRLKLPKPDRTVHQGQISFTDVAREAHLSHDVPLGMVPGLDETVFFDPKAMPTSYGTHIAIVEVETATGEIRLNRHIVVDDCGRVINPLLARGQVHGSVAQGVGQALMEQIVYDRAGGLVSDSFATYAMPRATDLPDFETGHTVVPTTTNPLGAKGIGEGGTIGAPPAIVNAVLDALRPLGVQDIEMPLAPMRVWRAIEAARNGENS